MPFSAVFPLFKAPFELSLAVCAVKECWTGTFCSGSYSAHVAIYFPFCRQCRAARPRAFSLKQQRCPRCGCAESLNRHSFLHGNDPTDCAAQTVRGQRVFCSSRGQRGGCGKTFSIFLADILPRHSVTATMLWKLLIQLLAGLSVKAAAQSLRLPFALETFYALLRRLRLRLPCLRPLLAVKAKPVDSGDRDPLLQTLRHFQCIFGAGSAVEQFQLILAYPLMG